MIQRRWTPSGNPLGRELRPIGLMLVLAVSATSGWAQSRMDVQSIQVADKAVLESTEPRSDFSCQVTPQKPTLGFDLRFHAGYLVTVPIKVLGEAGGRLQVLMRVRPTANSESPVYFAHQFRVPRNVLTAGRDGVLLGGFDLGPGRYNVDWLVRDVQERVCSSHWELDAKAGRRQRSLPLTLAPNVVTERVKDLFDNELSAERATSRPLQIKILLNLSPAKRQESILKPEDAAVLFSIVRSITREPRINRFSLVAFDLRGQKIIYRQDSAGTVDFAALGRAQQETATGTVSVRLLRDSESGTRFVAKLLTEQLSSETSSPDAIIVIGPKVTLEKKVPRESQRAAPGPSCPIFYLSYNPDPFNEPWRDTLGSALKAYKFASEYSIVFPHDWGVAMRDMLSRIAKRPAAKATINSQSGAQDGVAFQQYE
jgi:hypothetical protein